MLGTRPCIWHWPTRGGRWATRETPRKRQNRRLIFLLRFLAKNNAGRLPLTIISDERTFVRDLFLDFSFLTVTEPRVMLTRDRRHVSVTISSAGRQLLGFLAKIGTLLVKAF